MIKLLGVLAALSCLVGCGSDDNGSGSGVDGNKKMSELTASEATSLCNAHKSDFDLIAKTLCVAIGVNTAGSKAACETSSSQCQDSAGSASIDCTSVDTADLADCSITVSAVEGCLTEFKAYAPKLTCDLADDPSKAPATPACLEQLTNCKVFSGE